MTQELMENLTHFSYGHMIFFAIILTVFIKF